MTTAPERPIDIRIFLERFWSGFVTPSRFAFGLMLAVLLALFLLICVGFTPGLIVGPIGAYVARDTTDSDGFATRDALRLALLKPTDSSPRLIVIGDSIMAQALGDDTLLARTLQARTARSWHISFLTSAGQSPIDEAALADYGTRWRGDVVIVPLSPNRFGYTGDELIGFYRQARLGIRSDWADGDIELLGERPALRTGIYAIDNRKFLSRNLRMMSLHAFEGQSVQRRVDSYLVGETIDANLLQKQRHDFIEGLYSAWRRDDPGIRMLTETIRDIERRGGQVIFVEAPVNRAIFRGPADELRYAAYLKQSAALAHDLGGSYCLLAGRSGDPSGYADYFHVTNGNLQARFRQSVAACVATRPLSKAAA